MDAVAALAPGGGLIAAACTALGLSRARLHRRQAFRRQPLAAVRPRPTPRRALVAKERKVVIDLLRDFYLYVIIDIFSRRVVAWQIADAESAALFKPLFDDAVVKHNVAPGQLTLHADRGGPMKAKATALMLADLSVTKSHSRPYTSNDNPFSESHFKTLKYRVLQKHGGSA
jgi:transposase InsO family protein